MKRFFALLGVSVACLALTINAVSQTPPVLYDSSIKTPVPRASSTDIARVYKELLRVAATQLTRVCALGRLPTAPELVGLARGAFTRKGAAQVAWLFQLCYVKRYDDGFYGLVILENGRTVRVSSIRLPAVYALATELYSLRDINLNGTDELALLWGTSDGEGSARVLSLLELTNQKLSSLGQLRVYESYSADSGIGTENNVNWKVYVVKGKLPVFIATAKSGKGSPVTLSLDKPELELQTFLAR